MCLLNAIRAGRLTTAVVQTLLGTRSNVLSAKDGIIPTRLCTHRRQAAQLNEQRLKELNSELRTFTAVDSAHCPTTLLDTACAQKLRLKLGAQVLLTKNLDLSRQLCNGSRGVVQEFDRESGEIFGRLKEVRYFTLIAWPTAIVRLDRKRIMQICIVRSSLTTTVLVQFVIRF